jgi:predicted RNase H-like HicB family nuclease
MLYPVLIQVREDGKFEASVPSIPGLTRAGNTRDDALQEIREAITETVSGKELVWIDVPLPDQLRAVSEKRGSEGKIDPLIGLFDLDDPDLGENAEVVLNTSKTE